MKNVPKWWLYAIGALVVVAGLSYITGFYGLFE